MRKIYIAGNWKLNFTQSETKSFLEELKSKVKNLNNNIRVLVHPSFTSLSTAQDLLKNSNIQFGAQNCSCQDNGAFTGEVSVAMLKETGVSSIIIGHSERREIFKETDENINSKLKAIRKVGSLTAIVCCGESEETREQGNTDTWVEKQIEAAFKDVQLDASSIEKIVIAYEPIWAIGTGKTCDSNEANRVIKVIRNKFSKIYSKELSDKISILYGGSVKASNIEELLKTSDIDGALIGGASLKTDEFVGIIDKSNSLLASSAV